MVAITGAAGCLGKLARIECEAMGLKVLGIDLPDPRCQGGPGLPGAQVADSTKVDRACDLAAPGGLPDRLLEGCGTLVHLAGDGRPGAPFEDVLQNNIVATHRIFEEARRAGVRRVVFASTNHTQNGSTMAKGSPSGIDWQRLESLGGCASVRTTDPLGRAGPDSFYAVSKLTGEALGSLYARAWGAFEFVALRIGWCLYDSADALRGTDCEDYLRAMYCSRRDFRGFLRGALTCKLDGDPNHGFLTAYAVSRNGKRMFDIEGSVKALGYEPQDDAEDHFAQADV